VATRALTEAATSRLCVGGRRSSAVVSAGRIERAATAWSTSISRAAMTAVRSSRWSLRAASGHTARHASAACWAGSV
jgi:hypothetical protein